MLSMGIRQSLGVFLLAVSEDLGPGREPFSLAVAVLSLLMGLPVAGYLADRYDHRRVLLICALTYGGGLVMASRIQSSAGLVLYLGVVAGLGTSGLSFGVLMGAVGRLVPFERRSAMMGLVAAGASMGMVIVAPAAQWGLEAFGWRPSFAAMGVAGFGDERPCLSVSSPGSHARQGGGSGRRAVHGGTREGPPATGATCCSLPVFFVNGFHIGLIVTHLPPT